MNGMKPIILFLLAGLIFSCSFSPGPYDNTKISFTELEEGFQIPPDSIKPWVYWYWMNDNISKEGISRDLEAMASVGIGEALIGNQAVPGLPAGPVPVLSEEWLDLTEHAIIEGDRTGVDIGLFNCPGWSQSGGPWIEPHQAMRYLTASEVVVEGPAVFNKRLTVPADDFQDVAVLAYPVTGGENWNNQIEQIHSGLQNVDFLFDSDFKRPVNFPEEADSVVIEINLKNEYPIRSLTLHPVENKFTLNGKLQVFDRSNYRTIRNFVLDRHNDRLVVGPIPYGPVSFAFPAAKAKKYRLVFMKPDKPAGLTEIVLSAKPTLEYYIEKQLGKMYQDNLPDWYAYQWRLQPDADVKEGTIDPDKVIDLSENLKENTLIWDIPEGKWKIIRLGMTPTGVTNHGAMPHAMGLEVDKMNKDAVNYHFDAFVGRVLERLDENERKAFKHIVADSYETGSQNWTDGFRDEFIAEYDYDPLTWLPVINGDVVGTPGQSERFLWDLRRLIADKIAEEYSGTLRELSNKNGMKLWLENYGHWGFPTDFLKYGSFADQVSGEFWAEGNLGSIECRAASSAANIYGKKVVSAESYTAAGKHFQRHPGYLKKRGDWSFTEGINHVVLHLYIQQPWNDSVPGVSAWFGTEFNRHNTYFDQLGSWIDYQRRCMFMLQQGNPVKDVAYFIGEDAPVMTGIQHPPLPEGYDFDYINADVIMNRLEVEDGKLVLPEGISYSVLALPPLNTMRPELLKKLKELIEEGAVVVGSPPQHSPSLEDYPTADKKVAEMSNEIWGDLQEKEEKIIDFGKGKVFVNMNLEEVFSNLDVPPDVDFTEEQNILYTHRSAGNAEIYFLSNQTDQTVYSTPVFRVSNKYPQLWNPVTGEIRALPEYEHNETGIKVPLRFLPAQSWFVVFTDEKNAGNATVNFPEYEEITDLSSDWKVAFNSEKRGPQQSLQFENLTDWSKHENDSVKYYSGTARYSKSFNYRKGEGDAKVKINLGEVAVMADVFLNGQKIGNVWHEPYELDVTEYLKDGENLLEVEVVNLWVNRLIGDSKLPPAERQTYATTNPYNSNSPLQHSGLLGPVRLEREKLP